MSEFVKFVPKIGRILKVLCVCRISGDKQDPLSLKDQEALLRNWVAMYYAGQVEYIVISGIGSGEVVDRAEAIRIQEEAATGKYDLVIAEDIGRIYRRLEAMMFCETCQDAETRVVAINDHVDTAKEDWRMLGFFAVMRHEMYNRDTAKRIRRTLRNRFVEGGVVQTLIPGYIKPPGAKLDTEIQKDPFFESIYDTWFELLQGGASYAEVADWLNEINVPLGRYAKGTRWDPCRVARITRNPILKGVRQRNRKMSKRVNKTGRHKQVNAPASELLERACPHLAFIEEARYDRVLDMLTKKNSRNRRKSVDGQDPRLNVSRKRTAWPGQHLFCGVCGSMFEYGAHGQNDHLICSGARDYECWVSVSIDGPKARAKLCAAISERLLAIPEFDTELLVAVQREAEAQAEDGQKRLKELDSSLRQIEASLRRLAGTITEYGPSPTIMGTIKELEDKQSEILSEQHDLRSRPKSAISVPSAEEVRAKVRAVLTGVVEHDQVAVRFPVPSSFRQILTPWSIHRIQSVLALRHSPRSGDRQPADRPHSRTSSPLFTPRKFPYDNHPRSIPSPRSRQPCRTTAATTHGRRPAVLHLARRPEDVDGRTKSQSG